MSATAPRPQPTQTAIASWEDKIKLTGWSLASQTDQVLVTLHWQAESNMAHDYTAFVHLLADDGTLVAQHDRPPAGYPTIDWRPGEQIIDRYAIPIPSDLPVGEYQVQTGFYRAVPTASALTIEPLGRPFLLETVTIGTIDE